MKGQCHILKPEFSDVPFHALAWLLSSNGREAIDQSPLKPASCREGMSKELRINWMTRVVDGLETSNPSTGRWLG